MYMFHKIAHPFTTLTPFGSILRNFLGNQRNWLLIPRFIHFLEFFVQTADSIHSLLYSPKAHRIMTLRF